jgi:hypothetical protein
MQHPDLVIIQAFGNEFEADIAKSALESVGIDSMIQADTAGGMRPHLAWSGAGFKLLVREEDAATARDVLKPGHEIPSSYSVVVGTFATQAEADGAADTLFSSGIDAHIVGDFVGGVLSPGQFRVLVPEEQAAAARELLKPRRDAPV